MSKSRNPTRTPPSDAPTADELYEDHGDAIDEYAQRDDVVGVLARVIRERARDER